MDYTIYINNENNILKAFVDMTEIFGERDIENELGGGGGEGLP